MKKGRSPRRGRKTMRSRGSGRGTTRWFRGGRMF